MRPSAFIRRVVRSAFRPIIEPLQGWAALVLKPVALLLKRQAPTRRSVPLGVENLEGRIVFTYTPMIYNVADDGGTGSGLTRTFTDGQARSRVVG